MFTLINTNTTIKRIGLTIPLLMLSMTSAIAQTPTPQKSNPLIEPIPHALCRDGQFYYQQKTIREINGKKYICTSQGWVLLQTIDSLRDLVTNDSLILNGTPRLRER